MELDNAVEQGNRLKRLIEHEDLIILSANDRQGLKKAMDRKRKYVQKLKKLEVEEMEKEGKNVFISGSLDNEDEKAYKIAKAICRRLIDNGFNIVTGFGKGIGYYVAGASIVCNSFWRYSGTVSLITVCL